MIEAGVVFFFVRHLYFFGHVLGVGIAEKIAVSGFTKPVVASLQLIVVVLIVIAFCLLLDVSVTVRASTSQREIASYVLVSRLYVLVVSSISWKLRRVRTQVCSGAIAVEEVLRMRPLDFIAVAA